MFILNFKKRLHYIDTTFSDYYISELASKFDERKLNLFIQNIRDCMWIESIQYESTSSYNYLFDIFLEKIKNIRNVYLDKVLTMFQKIHLNFIQYELKESEKYKDCYGYKTHLKNYIDKIRYINLDFETSHKYYLYKHYFDKTFNELKLETLPDVSLEFLSVLRNTLLRQNWHSEKDFNLLSKQLEKINIVTNKREVLKKYNLSNDISFSNISNLNNNQFYEILTCLYNDNTDKIAKIFNYYNKSSDIEKSLIDSEIKCLINDDDHNNNYLKILKECCDKHVTKDSNHLNNIKLKTIT